MFEQEQAKRSSLVNSRVKRVLKALLKAREYALDAGRDVLTPRTRMLDPEPFFDSRSMSVMWHLSSWELFDNGRFDKTWLAENVRPFQNRFREIGIALDGGNFPVQTIPPIPGINARQLHAKLNESGIRTVLVDQHDTEVLRVACLISAKHVPTDLDIAADAIAKAIADADAVHA